MRHQAGDGMDIAREAIELCDRDRATQRSGLSERRRQLRPTVERVDSLAGLDLDEFDRESESGFLRKPPTRPAVPTAALASMESNLALAKHAGEWSWKETKATA